MTGARPEELLALPWSNVDLDGRTLSIPRRGELGSNTRREGSSFTGAALLRAEDEGLEAGHPDPARARHGAPVVEAAVPGIDSEPRLPETGRVTDAPKVLYDSGLVPALARAGLRHFDVYSLRHCFASTLAVQGGRRPKSPTTSATRARPSRRRHRPAHWPPQREQMGALDQPRPSRSSARAAARCAQASPVRLAHVLRKPNLAGIIALARALRAGPGDVHIFGMGAAKRPTK